jgi:hypothetical protein
MIKSTKPKNQKTPKVMKNKCSYGNKGTVPLKINAGTFSTSTTQPQEWAKGRQEVLVRLLLVVSFLAFIKCQPFG